MPEDDSSSVKGFIAIALIVVVLFIFVYFVVPAVESWIHNTSVSINNWFTQNLGGIVAGIFITLALLLLLVFVIYKLKSQ